MPATIHFPNARRATPPRRGAASLVVVMILFFIITLVAAYTSRNLLFEQRTSANQYRATLAFEAADAGIEWTIARLNEGRMNDDCTELAPAAAVGAEPSFRERYLAIDPVSGVITVPDRIAGCVFNGATWVCHCPDAGNPAPAVVPVGNGPFPAFWVRFRSSQVGGRPGIVRIQVNACTRADAACLNFTREAQSGDGLATVWSMVALRSALPSAPAAALTVRGAFAAGPTNTPAIQNTDTISGGITIHGGSAIAVPPAVVLRSIPGTPANLSFLQNDPALELPDLAIVPATPANDGRNRMFNSVFGTWPATFFAQPGLTAVDCTGNCTAANINAAVLRKPGHAIHAAGGGRLLIDAAIGSALAPVLIIADGTVEFDPAAATLFGVVYSRAANWELEGGDGIIQGAAIAERAFTFDTNNPSILYDRDVLLRIRNLTGSFAKVPGSWRDFQPLGAP